MSRVIRARRASVVVAVPVAPAGLQFLQNETTGSDIRLNWKGANILARNTHSVIVKAKYTQQAGYYATIWHTSDDGTWHGGDGYDFGCHPYPSSNGAVDGGGLQTSGTGSIGTTHYYECAGLDFPGGGDFLATPGGTAKIVVKDVWVTHFRKSEIISGTTLRVTFYPDIDNAPSYSIVQEYPLADVADPGVLAAFIIGCSPWVSSNWAGTGSGYSNGECPYGIVRCLKFFTAALTLADAQSEAASGLNSPVTTAGTGSVWYMNESPTPTDVTDKSGAGHNPAWANANRPTLWSGP